MFNEQNMRDLQRDLFFDLGRHVPMRLIHILRCPAEELKIHNHASQRVAYVQRLFPHLSLWGNLMRRLNCLLKRMEKPVFDILAQCMSSQSGTRMAAALRCLRSDSSQRLNLGYSRKRIQGDLSQGWKLHVSATILSACRVLRLLGPYMKRRAIWFKAPKSLAELRKLNSGIYYGFSQIGKFITVYPRSAEAAAAIASELQTLPAKFAAPMVT